MLADWKNQKAVLALLSVYHHLCKKSIFPRLCRRLDRIVHHYEYLCGVHVLLYNWTNLLACNIRGL